MAEMPTEREFDYVLHCRSVEQTEALKIRGRRDDFQLSNFVKGSGLGPSRHEVVASKGFPRIVVTNRAIGKIIA